MLKKLKKSFLKKHKIAKALTEEAKALTGEVAGEVGDALVPYEPSSKEPGPLAGEFVRVHDEGLGVSSCGFAFEVLSHEGDSLLLRLQASGGKVGKHINCQVWQIELLRDLEPTVPWKKMMLTKDLRIELDLKFPAHELAGAGSLAKDKRLAAQRLDMVWWLIARDQSLKDGGQVCYFAPEFSAQLFHQLVRKDLSAADMHGAYAAARARIGEAKLVMLPVWGGLEGSQHWTLLTLSRDETDQWQVRYRDSLKPQSACCKNAAEKLLKFVAAVVQMPVVEVPAPCNKAFQIDSINCGCFVAHWMEVDVRSCLGQGLGAAGYPSVTKWLSRLELLIAQIVNNQGVAELEAERAAEQLKKQKEQEKQVAELVKKIQKDKEFQALVAEGAKASKFHTFASTGGCPKCRHAKFGSSCCNPDKIEAKRRAEELWAKKQGLEKAERGK